MNTFEAPSTPPTAGKPQYPRWIWLLAAGVVVVVAIAIAAVYIVGGPSSDTVTDAAVEQFIPTQGSKIFQQQPIGVDLASGYDGTLALNGTAIPDDQLDKVPALNQVEFTPGPGKVVEQYNQGQNCVLATFWLIKDGPGVATTRSWCFTVV